MIYNSCVLSFGLFFSIALKIEEIEVEKRTLHGTFPESGLNMILGGLSGLRFLGAMTKKKPAQIDIDGKENELEKIINDSLRQNQLDRSKGYKNEKLAALWQEDIEFIIRAMTNRRDRLSYDQIYNARIWYASGWSLEKIQIKILEIDDRDISLDQISQMLNGVTYQKIPHVLIVIK